MIRLASATSILVMMAVPAAVQAAPQPASTAATAKSSESDVNKVVCKREEQIGSRLRAKKVCLTVKQWQDRAAADRDTTERVQQQTSTRSGG